MQTVPSSSLYLPHLPKSGHLAGTQSILEGGGGGRKREKEPSFFPCSPPPLTEELIHLSSIKAKFRFVFIRIYIQNVLQF